MPWCVLLHRILPKHTNQRIENLSAKFLIEKNKNLGCKTPPKKHCVRVRVKVSTWNETTQRTSWVCVHHSQLQSFCGSICGSFFEPASPSRNATENEPSQRLSTLDNGNDKDCRLVPRQRMLCFDLVQSHLSLPLSPSLSPICVQQIIVLPKIVGAASW